MTATAYVGRYRYGDHWKLQLIGYGRDGGQDIYAEVEAPDDSLTLLLVDEFFEAICASKGLTMKSRRGNDE